MNKLLEITLAHPKKMLSLLALITLLSLLGIRNITFDSSSEVLMPHNNPTYQLGVKARKDFIDSETFHLVSIEAVKGKKILSKEMFSHINEMVMEIEEYKDFNFEKENERLNKVIACVNISIFKNEQK